MEPELQRVLTQRLLARLELAQLQAMRQVCRAVIFTVNTAPLPVWRHVVSMPAGTHSQRCRICMSP